jgi:DNA-binding transcriptional regulator PaaX
MKANSLKLLLWLYSDNLQEPFVSDYNQLGVVLPELTAAGLRSLTRNLVTQQLVRTETVLQRTTIRITAYGVAELHQQFPALRQVVSPWQGNWSCLVFLKAPKTDQGFRYLRTVLLGEHALQLHRGVYLFPGSVPERVERMCRELYVGAVTVFTIGQWLFGDERSTVVDSFSLSDVVESYSGISKDINQLLSVKNTQKGSYQTLKNQISSVFDRLFICLTQDTGLAQYYFTQTVKPHQLLHSLHNLI